MKRVSLKRIEQKIVDCQAIVMLSFLLGVLGFVYNSRRYEHGEYNNKVGIASFQMLNVLALWVQNIYANYDDSETEYKSGAPGTILKKDKTPMIIKILTAVLLLMTLSSAANNCWKIKDKDTRLLCESKFENKKSCWQITNSDKKAYCEATAYGQNSCWKIKNSDYKEMCIAESGR